MEWRRDGMAKGWGGEEGWDGEGIAKVWDGMARGMGMAKREGTAKG